MKIFVSWSGRVSEQIAAALTWWLPLILQYARPWMSDNDIHAGDQWFERLRKGLGKSKFGIACVTPDNLTSEWLLFECGGLGQFPDGAVCPLMFGLPHTALPKPLTQFQATRLDKDGIWALVTAINKRAKKPVPEDRLAILFEVLWPLLEAELPPEPPTSQTGVSDQLPPEPPQPVRIKSGRRPPVVSPSAEISSRVGLVELRQRVEALERIIRNDPKAGRPEADSPLAQSDKSEWAGAVVEALLSRLIPPAADQPDKPALMDGDLYQVFDRTRYDSDQVIKPMEREAHWAVVDRSTDADMPTAVDADLHCRITWCLLGAYQYFTWKADPVATELASGTLRVPELDSMLAHLLDTWHSDEALTGEPHSAAAALRAEKDGWSSRESTSREWRSYDVLREYLELRVRSTSLRALERETGISREMLRRMVVNASPPGVATLRRLRDWYLRDSWNRSGMKELEH